MFYKFINVFVFKCYNFFILFAMCPTSLFEDNMLQHTNFERRYDFMFAIVLHEYST